MVKIDFGSLPDWISGVGTASATLLLAFSWLRENRVRKREHERQTATSIRQLFLEIERIYDSIGPQDELTDSSAAEERRLVRELETQSVLLPEPFGPRLYKISTFIGESAIRALHGDSLRVIAWRSCNYGKKFDQCFSAASRRS
ncbi:hypothetical protein [Actinoplanes sp. RD1]|uniref:hypothetical protein n=1 Tax=Actinoplanes sp. RD1 TaxID=3064538 RepID=UPI002741715E|nr:hypothetical protein [Actinoplanes sp. RD1]